MSSERTGLRSSIYESLVAGTPSEVPELVLPFGEVPERLREKEVDAPRIPVRLQGRIRALADNANELKYTAPQRSAMFWHEAGRLLDRHAGHPVLAWRCYSRAVSLVPDHKPSLTALRRLARFAGQRDVLELVVETSLERATNPIEIAGLNTELAILAVEKDDRNKALDGLREAVRAHPDALVSLLIKIGVAAGDQDDDELLDTLTTVLDHLGDAKLASDVNLTLALIEERLGKLDSAFERLQRAARVSRLSLPGQWALFRLCLRLDMTKEAFLVIEGLVSSAEDPHLKGAFKRIRGALAYLPSENLDVDVSHDIQPEDPVWDLQTLGMAKRKDWGRSAAAAVKLVDKIENRALREAVAISKVAHGLELGIPIGGLDPNIDRESVPGRAVASYLGLSAGEDYYKFEEGHIEEAEEIFSALYDGESQRLVASLSRLRESVSSSGDRWTLAVAESAVRIDLQDDSEGAIKLLRGQADTINEAPLPIFIRAFDATSTNLAELALAESMDAEDEISEAHLLGLAACHLEQIDLAEAGRLYQRALALLPQLQFAILGLERTVANSLVSAEACLSGALVATEKRTRLRFLARAGIHFMVAGQGLRAAELLAEALNIGTDDDLLFETVVRLSLSYPSIALQKYVEFDAEEASRKSIDNIFMQGALALELAPENAVAWFELALTKRPDDIIALSGLKESRLASGRSTVISSDLLTKLRNAESTIEEAATYARLAHIDRFYQNDLSSSILSLVALHEKFPGHPTTLVRLVTHYLSQGGDEVAHVLSSLGHTVCDDEDHVALLTAAWRHSTTFEETLRGIVQKNDAAILEAVHLEAITEDVEMAVDLLEKCYNKADNPNLYIWRLAEKYAEFGFPARAIDFYNKLLSTESASLFELYCLSLHQRAVGDYAGLLNTLRWMADKSSVLEYRVGVLWEAVDICRTNLQDYALAVQLCIQILSLVPGDTNAYQLGLELLVGGDPGQNAGRLYQKNPDRYDLLIELMRRHLVGLEDSHRKSELHQTIALALLSSGREDLRQQALESIHAAVALVPEDVPAHRWLANLYCEDQNWPAAIEQLIAAAKIVSDPILGQKVFFQLGTLYMDYTDRSDLAEKSFIKVLSWNRSHFEAMERIGELYLRIGKTGRAVQAWEHSIHLAEDITTKVHKMVELARMKTKYFGATKEAERILCEARRIDPYSLLPLEALATLFQLHKDPLALHVHLDGALAQHAAVLLQEPDRVDVYKAIRRILTLRGEDALAAMALDAIGLVEGNYIENTAGAELTSWDVGTRMAESAYDEFLCPATMPAGVRLTMKTLGELLASLVGVSAKQVNLDRYKRLEKGSPLYQKIAEMSPGFKVPTPIIYVGGEPEIRIAPGTTSAVMVSRFVAETRDTAILHFICNYVLKMIALGISIVTIVPPRPLRLLMSAVVRLSVPGYEPDGMSLQDLLAETKRLSRNLSSNTIANLRPFAFDCMEALKASNFSEQLMSIGYRVGFIGAGSLPGALRALRVLSGTPTGPLSNVRGAGELMSYVFSRAHIELRMRLGL